MNSEDGAADASTSVTVQQTQKELRLVEQAVSEVTGLSSHWNGTVELRVQPGWRGAKPFQCSILLDAERQSLDVRWRTHLHEMLYAHSTGYTRLAFDDFPGWEEGVVERLQRLLRPRILERLSLDILESVFSAEEAAHEFNAYIKALDDLYRLLRRAEDSETDFYVALLATPINQRMVWMLARGRQLPSGENGAFVRVFAAANAILRRRLHP